MDGNVEDTTHNSVTLQSNPTPVELKSAMMPPHSVVFVCLVCVIGINFKIGTGNIFHQIQFFFFGKGFGGLLHKSEQECLFSVRSLCSGTTSVVSVHSGQGKNSPTTCRHKLIVIQYWIFKKTFKERSLTSQLQSNVWAIDVEEIQYNIVNCRL